MSDKAFGGCDSCGAVLWESDGYLDSDIMCFECFYGREGCEAPNPRVSIEHQEYLAMKDRIKQLEAERDALKAETERLNNIHGGRANDLHRPHTP